MRREEHHSLSEGRGSHELTNILEAIEKVSQSHAELVHYFLDRLSVSEFERVTKHFLLPLVSKIVLSFRELSIENSHLLTTHLF